VWRRFLVVGGRGLGLIEEFVGVEVGSVAFKVPILRVLRSVPSIFLAVFLLIRIIAIGITFVVVRKDSTASTSEVCRMFLSDGEELELEGHGLARCFGLALEGRSETRAAAVEVVVLRHGLG
jgi:hypothetical protein